MKVGRNLFVLGLLALGLMAQCDDEDITGTCAGCQDDAVWSVFGSKKCYITIEECEAAETGDCVICN